MPVAVLMFGFDNPDAILTLLLTASTYAFIRALENANPIKWLSISAILTGFAFNTKMLQGLIVLPVFVLVYIFAAKPKFWQRIKHILIAGIFLAISALWWPLIVTAIPKTDRPYIGSSSNDSIWNLIIGYNGVGRLLGEGTGQGAGGGGHSGGAPSGLTSGTTGRGISTTRSFGAFPGTAASGVGQSTKAGASRIGGGAAPSGMNKIGTGIGGFGGGPGSSSAGFGGSTGILRMFNSSFGPNIGWLIPVGLSAVVFAFFKRRKTGRTDTTRAAYFVWGGYLVMHIIVFSMVSGVIHPYYPVVMAPAVAALVGMGLPALIKSFKKRDLLAIFLPLTVMVTAYVAFVILGYESLLPWLKWVVVVAGVVCGLTMLVQLMTGLGRKFAQILAIAGVVIMIAGPTVYALDTATVTHTGSIPSAGPSGTGMAGSNNESATAEKSLITYLLNHEGKAKWLVAVASADVSAGIQISSGQPVMAVGGFDGSDDALSISELKQLVATGQLEYYAISSGGMGGGASGTGDVSQIQAWVEANGVKVKYGGSQYTLYKLSV
jgi:4-amino-4-deoxy-L-arabinose transferase-like glycosyltransferase